MKRTGALLFALIVVLALPPLARAQDVELSSEQVRQQLFVAGDVARLSARPGGARDVVLEKVLQRMYQLQPELDPAQAKSAISDLDARLDARLPSLYALSTLAPNAVVQRILTELQNPLPPGVSGAALQYVVRQALVESADTGIPGDRFNVSADALDTLSYASFDPATVLSGTVSLAAANQRFGQARDALWAGVAKQSVFASAAQLLAGNPLLQTDDLKPVTSRIGSNGTLRIGDDILRSTSQSAIDGMNATTRDTLAAAADPNLSGAARDTRAAAAAADVERRATAAQFAARASNIAHPNTAAQKTLLVARTASQIGQAVSAYLQSAKVMEKVTSLSKVGLSGNLALAALNLAPLFIDMGPSTDELILKQLAAIQEQIADFREDVDQRFNDVDLALRTLDTKMDDLRDAVNGVSVDVKGTFDAIVDVRLGLDRMTARLYDVAEAQGNRDIFNEINFSLGYAGRSGGAALPASDFLRADSKYFTYATQASVDAISVPTGRKYGVDDVRSELGDFPADKNLDYLRHYPAQVAPAIGPMLGDQGTTPLANPKDWALGARAYTQLLLENPAQVTPAQRARLGQSLDLGVRLRRFTTAIGANTAPTRSGSVLFNRVFDDYRAVLGRATNPAPGTVVAELKREVAEARSDQQGLAPSALPGTEQANLTTSIASIDPWGGAGQAIGAQDRPVTPSRYEVSPCGYPGVDLVPLPGPARLENQPGVSDAVFLARRLGAVELALPCYSTTAVNVHPDDIPWLVGRMWGRVVMRFVYRIKFKNGNVHDVVTASYTFPEECIAKCQDPSSFLSPPQGPTLNQDDLVSHSWDPQGAQVYVNGYEDDHAFIERRTWTDNAANRTVTLGDAATVMPAGSATTKLRKAIDDELAARTAGIWGSVLAGLKSGPTHDAAARLDGQAKLLRAYAAVGLAPAMASDEPLRTALDSTTGLIDEDAQAGSRGVSEFIATNAATTGVQRDITADLAKAGDDSATAAEQQLARFIIPASGTPARGARAAAAAAAEELPSRENPLIDTTIQRLNLVAGLLDHPASEPGTPAPEGGTPGPEPGTPAPTAGTLGPSGGSPSPAPQTPLTLRAKLAKTRFAGRKGTQLTLTASRAAAVTVTLQRTARGRLKGKRCVAPTTARKGRACTRVLQTKTLRLSVRAGTSTVAFARKLARGDWQATLTAPDAHPVALKFRVS